MVRWVGGTHWVGVDASGSLCPLKTTCVGGTVSTATCHHLGTLTTIESFITEPKWHLRTTHRHVFANVINIIRFRDLLPNDPELYTYPITH